MKNGFLAKDFRGKKKTSDRTILNFFKRLCNIVSEYKKRELISENLNAVKMY